MVKLSEVEKKKVLIITYYWPPAGGPGVQRVLKFVKYLPQFGWEPVVLTVENGEYPAIDFSLEKDIPEGIKVYKTKTIEPFRLFKLFSGKKKTESISPYELVNKKEAGLGRIFHGIRNNIFFPDARVGFFLFNKNLLFKIIRNENPDLVFISSPPHSLQLFGLTIKKKYRNIPWVADFRDPWLDAFWEKESKRIFFINSLLKNLEKKVFRTADQIITVSEGLKNQFSKFKTKKEVIVLNNGFDESDFSITKSESKFFRITFLGSLGETQLCFNFLNSIQLLDKSYKELIRVKFIGNIHPEIKNISKKLWLDSIIDLPGYVPHSSGIVEIINSELLLLLIPKNSGEGVLTGKLFEYIGTGNTIWTISDDLSDELNLIFKNYGNGEIFNYNKSLNRELKKIIDDWKNNKLKQPTKSNLEQFTRKYKTKELVELFEKIF